MSSLDVQGEQGVPVVLVDHLGQSSHHLDRSGTIGQLAPLGRYAAHRGDHAIYHADCQLQI